MTRLLSAGMIAALMILVLAGTAAAATPPVPYFSQCDSRWSSDQLGGDGPTICSMGCALTSAAMVMAYYDVDTDPKRLNDAIRRGGYDVTYYIYWSAVQNACHDKTNRIEYEPGGGTSIDRCPLMQPWTDTQPQKGDLNGDDQITAADAVIALRIAAASLPCDPATLDAADVSGDGRVTSLDALMILQAAAGRIAL